MNLYWIIEQEGTDNCIPNPRDVKLGASWVVPVSRSKLPPRLFKSKKAAAVSLGQWLRGGRVVKSVNPLWGEGDIKKKLIRYTKPDRATLGMRVRPVALLPYPIT